MSVPFFRTFSEELRPIGRQFELTTPEAGTRDGQPTSASQAVETAELVGRCLAGDELAWGEFVATFEGPVFSLCFRMLRHRQDAEDVAQEALVRAIRHLHTWDTSRSIMPWLMTITANRCRTALSRRKRIPVSVDYPIEPSGEGATGEDAVSRGETAEEISRALDELRDEYRECFILFYQQELGCAEISEVLGCPTGTVKTWLHRARQELAERLRRRGITADGGGTPLGSRGPT